jgi:hypothetical protein
VSARNRLAHHYFWQRSGEFTIPQGQFTLIEECHEFNDCFEEACRELQRWQESIGAYALPEQEMVAQAKRHIVDEARAKYESE